MMSSEWELYVTAKILTFNKFQTFEGSAFLLILEKKTAHSQALKAKRKSYSYCSKVLRIIILRLITYLFFKYKTP